MNLGQVFARLDTLVGGSAKRTPYYPNTEAIDAVNDWVERIAKAAIPDLTTETFNLVAGTSAYTPATARLKQVVYLKYDSSGTEYETPLKPITQKEAMERSEGDPSHTSNRGTPSNYYVTFNSSGAIVLNVWPTPDTSIPAGMKAWFVQGPAALAATDTSTEIPVPHFFHQALPFMLAFMYYNKREDGKLSGIAESMLNKALSLESQAMTELVQVQGIRQPVVDVDFGGPY